jgi:carotenoid cleavage dioxygenase-like enzyme
MRKLRRRDLFKLGAGLSGAYLVENVTGCSSTPGAGPVDGGVVSDVGAVADSAGPLDMGVADTGVDAASRADVSGRDGADAGTKSDASADDAGTKPDADAGAEPESGTPDKDAGEAGAGLADTGPTLPVRFPTSIVKANRNPVDISLRVLSGKLPTDLTGHAFMIAALPWGDGTNIVNGDGMIYRLDFGRAEVPLKARLAKTACYYADRASIGTNNAFRNAGLVRLSSTLGVRNEANTAFVRMKDRLLITFDAGRPFEIDPMTLEIATPVGALSEWKRSLPDLFIPGPLPLHMSTAHPFYDEHTGELFTANYGPPALGTPAFTDVIRWDGVGTLEKWTVLVAGMPVEMKQSMHQIGVTQDYVILMDCAFSVSALQILIPNAPSAAPSPDSSFYIVKRSDLKAGVTSVTAKKIVVQREGAHFVCDYENPMGRITVHFGHSDAHNAAEWLRADDVRADNGMTVRSDILGMLVTTTDVNSLGRYVFDAEAGTLVNSSLTYDLDVTWQPAIYTHRGSMAPGRFEDIFWCSIGYSAELLTKRVLDLYTNYPYRRIPIASLPTNQQGALFRLDAATMKIADAYRVPTGRVLLSPQFVPRPGSTSTRDGYLVCSVMSDDMSWNGSTGDEFWIFDASNLAQGPLCRLAHPELDLGFTLHTTWMESIARRTAPYLVPARTDFAAGLANQSQEIKDLFEKEVFPHLP